MKNLAITIARQYGSGGREIGRRLGELLGIKFYDKELITMAAEKKGVDPDYLHKIDEKATNSLLYTLAIGSSLFHASSLGTDISLNDKLFIAQTELIREIAGRENAIFVGRCADYILRKHDNCVRLFIYADKEDRIARVIERKDCSRKEAEDLVAKNDKSRMSYYNFYTGKKWGRPENYDLCVNSSLLGVEGTAQMLAKAVSIRLENLARDAENGAEN